MPFLEALKVAVAAFYDIDPAQADREQILSVNQLSADPIST